MFSDFLGVLNRFSRKIEMAFPGVKVRQTVAQSIPNAAATDVIWGVADWDDAAFFNIATPTLLTVPAGQAGRYFIFYELSTASSATGYRAFILELNGVAISTTQIAPAGGNSTVATGLNVLELVVGDTINVAIFQNSTAARLTSNSTYDFLVMQRIR